MILSKYFNLAKFELFKICRSINGNGITAKNAIIAYNINAPAPWSAYSKA